MTGCPGVGKTFLAEKLAEHLKENLVLINPPNQMPNHIKKNLEKKKNLFETLVWFRNQTILQYNSALISNKNKRFTFLDSPFFQYQLFIDLYIKNNFQKDILCTLSNMDIVSVQHPDITIYISCTPEEIIKFLSFREGARSWEDQEWRSMMAEMAPLVNKYINTLSTKMQNIITINRSEYDFNIDKDLEKILKIINT